MTTTNTIYKILIIEDDYQMAAEWQGILTKKGYAVDSVASADDVVPLLKNDYDCFILDLFHVKNNEFLSDGGIRCISKIRSYEVPQKRKSLIIAVTGFFRKGLDGFMSTNEVVSNLGADVVLEKPFDVVKLHDLIEKNIT